MNWNILLICVVVFINFFIGCKCGYSSAYGPPPAPKSFVPAPPGKTPSCARPGHTYCEHPSDYPGELIHELVQKWVFDHSTILSNESPDEFTAYSYPPSPKPVYGPPNYHPPPPHHYHHYHKDLSSSSHSNSFWPSHHFEEPKIRPSRNFSHGFTFDFPSRGQVINYKYTDSFGPHYYSFEEVPNRHYHNELWKRHESRYERFRRALRYRRSQQQKLDVIESETTNTTLALIRRKRQDLAGETLCRTRSQFIMPRAALNNKGNWMYVVNMPEVDSQYTQLVKSEVCASQECSNLCTLPLGSTARCEQKYVQKRLVALEGQGSELYNDVFWIPSCCVCTISRN